MFYIVINIFILTKNLNEIIKKFFMKTLFSTLQGRNNRMRFLAALVDYKCHNLTSVRIYDHEGVLCSEKSLF